jgi:putative transposase
MHEAVLGGTGVPACAPSTEGPGIMADLPGADADALRRRNLPHLSEQDAVYMVTWRLRHGQPPLLPEERALVLGVLLHFDGARYGLGAYVVMDDHVHAVLKALADWTLSAVMHSWKSFSANRLQRVHGRRGAVWQDESYDRIVRSGSDLEEKSAYVLANPARRWGEAGDDYAYAGWGTLEV